MNCKLIMHCEKCGRLIHDYDGYGNDIKAIVEIVQELEYKYNDNAQILCDDCDEDEIESEYDFQDEQYRIAKGFM